MAGQRQHTSFAGTGEVGSNNFLGCGFLIRKIPDFKISCAIFPFDTLPAGRYGFA
jgi:hypothetical protein